MGNRNVMARATHGFLVQNPQTPTHPTHPTEHKTHRPRSLQVLIAIKGTLLRVEQDRIPCGEKYGEGLRVGVGGWGGMPLKVEHAVGHLSADRIKQLSGQCNRYAHRANSLFLTNDMQSTRFRVCSNVHLLGLG